MTPAPKCRWFRFSLLTLLVVVALGLVIGWVSVQLKWIRDRHAFRTSELTMPESGHNFSEELAETMIADGWPTAYHSDAPGMLGLFGEYGLRWLYISVPKADLRGANDDSYSISVNHRKVRTAAQLFPEAEIRAYWWDQAAGSAHDIRIEL